MEFCRLLAGVTLVACSATGSPRAGEAPPAPTEAAPTPVPAAASASEAPPLEPSIPAAQAPACRLAVALVVDRSGSMSGQPIEGAKEAVRAAMKELSKDDCAMVVAFDQAPTRIVALGPPSDDGLARVARISAGGGTEFLGALLMAHDDLAAAPSAKRRHIVLMTDGQSPSADLLALAKQMAGESMTLSTIGLGSGADENLLRSLADAGGGRFYKVPEAQTLPRVFSREIELLLPRH